MATNTARVYHPSRSQAFERERLAWGPPRKPTPDGTDGPLCWSWNRSNCREGLKKMQAGGPVLQQRDQMLAEACG